MPRPDNMNDDQWEECQDAARGLYEDFQRKMDSLQGPENGVARVKAMFDFCFLCGRMTPIVGDLDIQVMKDYFAPKKPNSNELDREKTQERFQELMDFRVQTIVQGFMDIQKEHPGHSDKWYKKKFFLHDPRYMYQGEMEDTWIAVFGDLDDIYEKAFPELTAQANAEGNTHSGILVQEADNIAIAKMLKKLSNADDIDGIQRCMKARQICQKAGDTVHTEEYEAEQHLLEQGEVYPDEADAPEASYKFLCNLDIDFVSNDIIKTMMKELTKDMNTFYTDNGPASIFPEDYLQKKNETLQKAVEQKDNFKTTRSFWHKDSPEYKDVKKKIKKLNEEIQDGGKVIDALDELETACQKYLTKNMNKGTKSLGKKRKEVVAGILEFSRREKAKMNASLTNTEKWNESVKQRKQAIAKQKDNEKAEQKANEKLQRVGTKTNLAKMNKEFGNKAPEKIPMELQRQRTLDPTLNKKTVL